MLSLLLDPRVWGVLLFVVLESMAGITVYNKGLDHGRTQVQLQFDAYRSKVTSDALAEQAKRAAETETLKTTNQKVTDNYVSLQAATSTAVRALDSDRMRLQSALAAARNRPAPSNPAAGLPPDASPEDGILRECLTRYEALAGDADTLSDTVKALQDYITRVVPK